MTTYRTIDGDGTDDQIDELLQVMRECTSFPSLYGQAQAIAIGLASR